jgi:hypothetical protein
LPKCTEDSSGFRFEAGTGEADIFGGDRVFASNPRFTGGEIDQFVGGEIEGGDRLRGEILVGEADRGVFGAIFVVATVAAEVENIVGLFEGSDRGGLGGRMLPQYFI